MAENFDSDLNGLIKKLNIIYFAQVAGLLFMVAVFGILRMNGLISFEPTNEQDYIINTIALLFSIIAIPLGYYIFSLKGKQCTTTKDEATKLDLYRSAKIIKFSLFELAGFLNIIAFGLSGSKQSLLFFAVVMIIFIINKPGENNFLEYFNNHVE